jgi:hypothetical protein
MRRRRFSRRSPIAECACRRVRAQRSSEAYGHTLSASFGERRRSQIRGSGTPFGRNMTPAGPMWAHPVANEKLLQRITLGQNSIHRGPRTVPGRLSDGANRPPAGAGARHRRTRSFDRSGMCGRAGWREATGVRLLQHRHGHRTSLQPGLRLLAFARVSKQEDCGRGQEFLRTCRGGRRASVALRIRSTKPCPEGRRTYRHRRTTATSHGNELCCGALLRCDAARGQFEGPYTPGPRSLVRPCGRAVPGDSGWRHEESSRWNHDGGSEHSDGTHRHRYDDSACVRPRHP